MKRIKLIWVVDSITDDSFLYISYTSSNTWFVHIDSVSTSSEYLVEDFRKTLKELQKWW